MKKEDYPDKLTTTTRIFWRGRRRRWERFLNEFTEKPGQLAQECLIARGATDESGARHAFSIWISQVEKF